MILPTLLILSFNMFAQKNENLKNVEDVLSSISKYSLGLIGILLYIQFIKYIASQSVDGALVIVILSFVIYAMLHPSPPGSDQYHGKSKLLP